MENIDNSSETINEARKKWDENGYLGVTAIDHELIGSTPDELLLNNKGKTLGELMSEDEIVEYISGTLSNIDENEKYILTNPSNKDSIIRYNEDLKNNLDLSINYLKKIGKIDEKFSSYLQ